jgi:hypothetical protein
MEDPAIGKSAQDVVGVTATAQCRFRRASPRQL